MNNQQIAELFTASVESLGQPVSLDYRDRAVELAIFFNDTIPDEFQSEGVIENVRWAMMLAYSKRYNLSNKYNFKKAEEGDDPNPSTEETASDSGISDSR